jgi:hypothetical protein
MRISETELQAAIAKMERRVTGRVECGPRLVRGSCVPIWEFEAQVDGVRSSWSGLDRSGQIGDK